MASSDKKKARELSDGGELLLWRGTGLAGEEKRKRGFAADCI
jgi:hypothetical protein